jgi:Protein of unknown function (DUF3105)
VAKKRRRPASRRPGPSRPRPERVVERTEPSAPAPRSRFWVRTLSIAVVGVLGWVLFVRAPGPGTIPASVVAAASAAGCDALERPVLANPSRDHLTPGDPYTYPDPPAAAGPHDPSPLPADPHVYDVPVPETRAVHNLEHAYVVIWYQLTDAGGPSADVISRLAALARSEDRVIMAPYPTMPDGEGLALLAWNTRWRCPGTISPDQAVLIARSFIDAYRGTTNAPEAPRGLLGPMLTK